jgi:hypothetical protein
MIPHPRPYACACGHHAFWINGKGWVCVCGSPRPFYLERKAA